MLENPSQIVIDALFHHYIKQAKNSNIPRDFYLASAQVITRIAPDRAGAFQESHPGVRNDLPAIDIMKELVGDKFKVFRDADYALTYGQTISLAKLWTDLKPDSGSTRDMAYSTLQELLQLTQDLSTILNTPPDKLNAAVKEFPEYADTLSWTQRKYNRADSLDRLYSRSTASIIHTAKATLMAIDSKTHSPERQAQLRVEDFLENYYAYPDAIERTNQLSLS